MTFQEGKKKSDAVEHASTSPPAYTQSTGITPPSKLESATLEVPRSNIRHRSRSADTSSLFSTDDLSESHLARTASHTSETYSAAVDKEGDTTPTWSAAFWLRNKGVLSVLLSNFFGVMMGVMTRFLELEGEGMHPFQVHYTCHNQHSNP